METCVTSIRGVNDSDSSLFDGSLVLNREMKVRKDGANCDLRVFTRKLGLKLLFSVSPYRLLNEH